MKTLLNPADKEEILSRLKAIQPTSQRRWGSMSVHNMICHLSDDFRMYMVTGLPNLLQSLLPVCC